MPFYTKNRSFLLRQARDKHRESTQKEMRFAQAKQAKQAKKAKEAVRFPGKESKLSIYRLRLQEHIHDNVKVETPTEKSGDDFYQAGSGQQHSETI